MLAESALLARSTLSAGSAWEACGASSASSVPGASSVAEFLRTLKNGNTNSIAIRNVAPSISSTVRKPNVITAAVPISGPAIYKTSPRIDKVPLTRVRCESVNNSASNPKRAGVKNEEAHPYTKLETANEAIESPWTSTQATSPH